MTLIEAAYDLLDEKCSAATPPVDLQRCAREVIAELGDGQLTFHIDEEENVVFEDEH